jgi:DNA polymerase delta subunit 1
MTIGEMVGAKRPLENGFEGPRKRPPADGDEDLIEEAFDMETQEDEIEDMEASLEVEEGALGEAGKNWMRPPPPPINASNDALVFQQFEVDYTSGPPNQQYYRTDLTEVPVLRMFGVNQHGNSVCTFVHGFEPYFYVEAPNNNFSPDDCVSLAETLNSALSGRDRSRNPRSCLRVEIVHRQTLLYYQPAQSRMFLKIYVAAPQLVSASKSKYNLASCLFFSSYRLVVVQANLTA